MLGKQNKKKTVQKKPKPKTGAVESTKKTYKIGKDKPQPQAQKSPKNKTMEKNLEPESEIKASPQTNETQTLDTNRTQDNKAQEGSYEMSLNTEQLKMKELIVNQKTINIINQEPSQGEQYKIKNQHLLNNLKLANSQTVASLSYSSQQSYSQRNSQLNIPSNLSKLKEAKNQNQLKCSYESKFSESQNSIKTYFPSNMISPEPDTKSEHKISLITSPTNQLADLDDSNSLISCTNNGSESNSQININDQEFQLNLLKNKQEQEKELYELQQEGMKYYSDIQNQIKRMSIQVDEIKTTLNSDNSKFIQNNMLSGIFFILESKCENCICMNNQLSELQDRIWSLERFIQMNENEKKKAESQNQELQQLIDRVENVLIENQVNIHCR